MVMGFVLYGKRFPTSKYLAVALITFGVSVFMFMDPHKSSKGKGHGKAGSVGEERTVFGSLLGLLLLTTNLVIDGITNSTQDRIFSQHKITGQQMMFFMNVCMAVLMSVYLVVSNPFTHELSNALSFCKEHPRVWLDIGLFSFSGALGQVFIFYTLQNFGSLVLVTVTVTRKMLSIILSVVWFGHVLSLGQWAGVAIVFIGIVLEDLMKQLGGAKVLSAKVKAKSEDGDVANGNRDHSNQVLTPERTLVNALVGERRGGRVTSRKGSTRLETGVNSGDGKS